MATDMATEAADASAPPSGKRSRAAPAAAAKGEAAARGVGGGGAGGGGGGGGAGLASNDPLLASLLGRTATPPATKPKASGSKAKAGFTHYSLDDAEGGEAANRDALAAVLQRTARAASEAGEIAPPRSQATQGSRALGGGAARIMPEVAVGAAGAKKQARRGGKPAAARGAPPPPRVRSMAAQEEEEEAEGMEDDSMGL